jgi:hypothetical protein
MVQGQSSFGERLGSGNTLLCAPSVNGAKDLIDGSIGISGVGAAYPKARSNHS